MAKVTLILDGYDRLSIEDINLFVKLAPAEGLRIVGIEVINGQMKFLTEAAK